MGVDSGTERQIDVSIRQQVSQFPILVIIDCKDYAEPIDVVDMPLSRSQPMLEQIRE
jgi:hypothetical protein